MYVVLVKLTTGGYYAIAASDSQERAFMYARYISEQNNLVCFCRHKSDLPKGQLFVSDCLTDLDSVSNDIMIRNIKSYFHAKKWNSLPRVDRR